MSRPPLAPVAVVGSLAVLLAVGAATASPPDLPRPAPVPLDTASVICPDLRQDPTTGLASRVAVGLADGADPLLLRDVLGGEPVEPAPLPLDPPGAVVGLGTTVDDAAYLVQASGRGAAGLVGLQTTTATGPQRGLAVLPCGRAQRDTWLVGGGQTVGERSELVLVNPSDGDAVVDVVVLTTEGPVDERPGEGIPVPARSRVVVPLDTIAPDRSRFAVHVAAQRGQVATALRHTRTNGIVPAGFEYAAAVPEPAAGLTVPALPAGPGVRGVWVANPGDLDVDVSVEVTAGDGQFVPEGFDVVTVPAHSTVEVDLSGVLAATPGAVRIEATGGKVLAAGFAEDVGAGDVREIAYIGAAPPLNRPAVIPDVVLDGSTDSVVLLTALDDAASATVSLAPVAGEPVPSGSREVEVPAGRTVAVPLRDLVPPETRGRAVVTVVPHGPLLASVSVAAAPAEGPLRAAWALRMRDDIVLRPPVVRDPGAATG